MTRQDGFGLWSGVGLVIANMIGAGVLLSTGYMVQTMSAGVIMGAWVLGLGLALCGAVAYASLSASITRSGGEYRYLSDIFHPFVGSMAGWGSLLIGFSGPIAIDAIAIGAFVGTLNIPFDPRWTGTVVVVALTLVHGIQWRTSALIQNTLVSIKVVLIMGLVLVGMGLGSWNWPQWVPPGEDVMTSNWSLMLKNQFWIAFAFSGWNAAIYAAEEFKRPQIDIGRAMLIGCSLVGLIYLAVNWVFVANLTPENASVVFTYDEEYVTLGHVLVVQLLGPSAATWMSLLVIVALTSACSAMMLIAPRIYSEMARDGVLPKSFAAKEGKPPLRATILQASIAIVLIHTHSILEAVESSSSVLMIFTMLTVAGVFILYKRKTKARPSIFALICAAIYIVLVMWVLWQGLSLSGSYKTIILFGLILIAATISTISRSFRQQEGTDATSIGSDK